MTRPSRFTITHRPGRPFRRLGRVPDLKAGSAMSSNIMSGGGSADVRRDAGSLFGTVWRGEEDPPEGARAVTSPRIDRYSIKA